MYFDRNATQNGVKRSGSAGMHRRSNAAWVLPQAVIRHLHDLAALKHHAADHPAFSELVTSALEADADRGDSVVGLAAQSPSERVSAAVATLATDPEYRDEYALFVAAMCYGAGEAPAFDSALAAVRHLGQRVG